MSTGRDRAVRLADGAWALADRDGLLIGILGGDIDRGWRSQVERLDHDDRAAVGRALNLGHTHATDSFAVRRDRRGTVLELSGGQPTALDDAAAARLQILCSHPIGGVAGAVAVVSTLPVGSARGGLRVYDGPILGQRTRVDGVLARSSGVVGLYLRTSSGPFVLDLPALPVLLAAAEAACDSTTVTLWLTDVRGGVTVVEVDAAAAQQSAADSQWLIPALLRQSQQTGSTSP